MRFLYYGDKFDSYFSSKIICEYLQITLPTLEENPVDMLTFGVPEVQTSLNKNVVKPYERYTGAINIADKYDIKLSNKGSSSDVNEMFRINKSENLDAGNVIKHTNENAFFSYSI